MLGLSGVLGWLDVTAIGVTFVSTFVTFFSGSIGFSQALDGSLLTGGVGGVLTGGWGGIFVGKTGTATWG